MNEAINVELKHTPLHGLHVAAGARMGPFAGYDMPIQYPDGVMQEHLHVRAAAGLFDVSHMGQAFLKTTQAPIGAPQAHEAIAAALESLAPGEFKKLKRGGLRYSVLLNDEGGVHDDFMATRPAMEAGDGKLFLVVNAACKEEDYALIADRLAGRAELDILDDRALLAIQGPKAAAVVDALFPGAGEQKFMTMVPTEWEGAYVLLSRCGYTGEDGFEISVPADDAERLAKALLAHDDVKWIGLGARDSLRLEAGLCLYGHDLDGTTSPVEGGIDFTIGKRRREEGGFPGADRILRELSDGPARRRVGILPEGRAPVREGAVILSADGAEIGVVTSGGFGPTLARPVAMGYVKAGFDAIGAALQVVVRGKPLPASVAATPFVPHRYYRG
ncbi:MAG: glycine cleavage system aminomethyltransferase GcvT [Alphaproteobacteria bacterium]|nr:glycine cleavage system aminomethyltransferase GcvT [Alphaproteobacteria bacterium]